MCKLLNNNNLLVLLSKRVKIVQGFDRKMSKKCRLADNFVNNKKRMWHPEARSNH